MFLGKDKFVGSPLHALMVLVVIFMLATVIIWMNKLTLPQFFELIFGGGNAQGNNAAN